MHALFVLRMQQRRRRCRRVHARRSSPHINAVLSVCRGVVDGSIRLGRQRDARAAATTTTVKKVCSNTLHYHVCVYTTRQARTFGAELAGLHFNRAGHVLASRFVCAASSWSCKCVYASVTMRMEFMAKCLGLVFSIFYLRLSRTRARTLDETKRQCFEISILLLHCIRPLCMTRVRTRMWGFSSQKTG